MMILPDQLILLEHRHSDVDARASRTWPTCQGWACVCFVSAMVHLLCL